MRAVILAAGFGRRMRPLTETTHKALLPIGGQAIISGLVDNLVRVGATEVIVVTGYRADEVEAHLAAHHHGVVFRFVRNERYAETNNIFSLALAFEHIVADVGVGPGAAPVVVVEADLVVEPAVFDRLMASPHDNVALVDRWHSGLDGTVVSVSGDVITGVFPSHRQTADFDFSDTYKTLNIYRFSNDFVTGPLHRLVSYYARSIDSNCFYEIIIGILIALQREPVHAAIIDGERWAEVDDPNDLDAARFVFEPASRQEILQRSHGGWWNHDVVDHAFLRNMAFPPGSMLSELRHQLPMLMQNYGSTQREVARKLSWALLADVAGLRVLNGASEGFPMAARHFAGRRVHVPAPTFGEYARAFPDAEPYADHTGSGVDLDALMSRVRTGDVVVFVNPNNPTGTTLSSTALLATVRLHPGIDFLIDESFIDFSTQPSVMASMETITTAPPNLIVLKSLSKCWGIPGLRLGYTWSSSPSWNARLDDELPIWNINSLAERVIELVLKHRDALQHSFATSRADRDAMQVMLSTVPGIRRVVDSGGNFAVVELESAAAAARVTSQLLVEHGVWVKDVSSKLGGGWLRLAVRTPVENQRLAALLGRVLTA